MAKNDIFKMSPEGKSEYCCNVVRIDEIKPIEGADAIGQVFVNVSESLVVRKDQVKPGDLLFYAENETELNPGFLAANNLFDISCYEMNSNAEEWRENMEKADALKESVKTGKDKIKKLKKYAQDYVKGDEEKKQKTLGRVAKLLGVDGVIGGETITEAIKLIEKANDEAVMEADRLRAEVKKHTGFFNKYGRVKMLRLKGTPSIGYLFTLDELIRWKPDLANEEIDMEALINQDFDTIGDELFVKAYVPRIKERKHTPKSGNKAQKKLQKFDRLIPGTFEFHYDTDPLGKNMWKINPDDVVDISVKCHGCVERNTVVETEEFGNLTIGEIVDNEIECHIKAFDTETNEIVFVPIDKFYMKPNDGEWYEIELENGKKITITGNNPVWLPELGVYRRVDELEGNEGLLFDE